MHPPRRTAVTTTFVVLGLVEGTWASRLPAIKAGLHLSPGVLGLALLGPALGCVLAMPATGAILATAAPRHLTRAGLVLMTAMLPLTAIATSAWQLFLILLLWGAGIGVVDVAMNTEAANFQAELGQRVMSGMHGAYSIGGLAGSGLGAITAAIGVGAGGTFIIAAITTAVAGLAATVAFAAGRHRGPTAPGGEQEAHRQHAAGESGARARWPQWSKMLVALGAMTFASFLGEGSAGNWSAVYLHSSLGAAPAVAAFGYAAFACAMTAGRLSGDWLTNRVGPVRLVRLSATLAAAGFGGALLIGHVWSALAGFALLGGGLSVVVPLTFTAAAGLGRPGPSLAMVTSCGYVGALAGPALIGGLASIFNIPIALGVVVLLSVVIATLAGAVRPTQQARAREPEVKRS